MVGATSSATLQENTHRPRTGSVASTAPTRTQGASMLLRSHTYVSSTRHCALVAAVFLLCGACAPACRADDASAPAAAQALPASAPVDTETGTISLIDQKNALIVVTVPGHDDLSFNAKNHLDVLNSIKVGDTVTAKYLEPYVTELSPAKGAAITHLTRTAKVTQYSPGSNEIGFHALRVFSGVAEVTGIDRKLNLLTFEDKSGVPHSVRVSRPDLVKVMQSLAHHSRVRIAYESESTVVISR